jgi:hypothetical protein
MNINQQTQGQYNCDGCFKLFLFSGVKRYYLDDNIMNVKMYCVLCSPCYDKELWSKKQSGSFPLLTGLTRNQEIKTPEFTRHEEDERVWRVKSKGLFLCDYCSELIFLGREIVFDMTRYELNTPEISCLRYCLVCFSCRKILDEGLDKGSGSINYAKFD